MKKTTKLLGEILIERHIITAEQLQEAMEYQTRNGGVLGEILVVLGYATEEQIIRCVCFQYDVPFLPLEQYEIPESVLTTIPLTLIRKFCVIPIDRIGNMLSLVVSDPSDKNVIRVIEEQFGGKIQFFVSTPSSIKRAIDKYYGALE